jgi:O-succinylbenzoate synthase
MAGVPGDLMRDVLASARVFAIPMRHRFRGTTVREGVLLNGPAGWAEFAPFRDYDDAACLPWLRAALDSATRNWPQPERGHVELNTTVPVVAPEVAAELVRASGCRTAKVKVAGPGTDLDADCARVAAVRSALGPDGRIRVDANASWTVSEAVQAITALADAAGGLEYVEQPCPELAELAEVRRRTDVPVAADESIRRAEDPARVALAGAADVAVVKVAPLGGVYAALRVAERAGIPVVVSSAVDTAVGLAAGLALAGALPELPYACGLGTGSLLGGDVTDHAPRPDGGRLPVPFYAPAPDERCLAEFAADAPAEAYWRARLDRVAALLWPAE